MKNYEEGNIRIEQFGEVDFITASLPAMQAGVDDVPAAKREGHLNINELF